MLLRREQFRVADDEQKSLCYAKSFIVGKLYNAKWVLERTKRDHALRVNIDRLAEQSGKLSAALLEARKSLTVDELRGVEGLAAKDYFYAFDDLVLKNKDDFFFTNRSRRPPLDRLNALLSFCYSILTNDCIAALQGVGLDPYVGFMHTDRPGRASLALDLVEEFRPVLADRFVLTLVNTGAVKPGILKYGRMVVCCCLIPGGRKCLRRGRKRRAIRFFIRSCKKNFMGVGSVCASAAASSIVAG